MLNFLWVALGGALGASLRYGISLIATRWSLTFPWGTLAANLIGCFIIGFFLPLAMNRFFFPLSIRLFISVGVLGGLTTFSTFSYESWAFFLEGNWTQGFFNVALNMLLSLGATGIGLWFASRF